jgi:GAF domain-containing protein
MQTAAAVDAFLAAAGVATTAGAAASAEAALLGSIVDAAASLFEAEAASIALYERDPERLEYRVASGEQGAGVVGLSVPPSRGVVGYVFSTAQPIALSDVGTDPRFDRATAERTGYVPRSIAAVPLVDAGSTLGVLQVLDKKASATFSLEDMTMLAAFARQASLALGASRVARDSARLLRSVLSHRDDGHPSPIDAAFAAAAVALDAEDEPPFWRLVDRLAGLADLPERDLALMADLLAIVTRRRGPEVAYRRRVADGRGERG